MTVSPPATYYDRASVTHVDGTRIFQTEEDRNHERAVAALLAKAWRCNIQQFGALSPVDWYAERNGRLVGVLELKSRPHASSRFPTVFLNVRKWLALSLASVGLGCPALFVVQLSDGVWWIPLSHIDATGCRIAGCMSIVKSGNDIEPIIEVPISALKPLRGPDD